MTGALLEIYVFFATWCVPCRQELPALTALVQRYPPGAAELVLVAEDASSSRDEVVRFLARVGARGRLIYDDDSALLERYNPSASLPFLVVLDRGQVLYAHRGYEPGDEDELAAILDRAVHRDATEASSARVAMQTVGVWRGDDFVLAAGPREARLAVARLDGEARTGGWRLAARLDGALIDIGGDEAMARADGDVRMERLTLGWEAAQIRVALGDAYTALGNSLTLALRRLDPLGTDTSLQGGHAWWTGSRVRARAHAGRVNPQNVDTLTYRTFDDPGDLAGGAAVEEDVAKGVTLVQSAAAFHLERAAPDGSDVRIGVAGLGISVDRGPVQLRAEAAGLHREDAASSAGGGGFASLSVRAGPWIATLETKLYRRFAIERTTPVRLTYHEPPTLERNDQEVPGNADAVGGRVALQRSWSRGAVTASALGYRVALGGDSPFEGGRVAHGYVTVEQRPTDDLGWSLGAGARDEREPDGALGLRFVQLGADAAARLPWRAGLTMKWDHRFEEKTLFGGAPSFVRGTAVASAAWASAVTLSAIYGYSTEAAARPVHYPAAEARIALGSWAELRALGGRVVGGRICVSGACRDVPSFEGVRVELLAQATW